MREILFRAKAVNRPPKGTYRTNYENGDWVYGLVNDINEYCALMTNTDGVSGIDVDPKTIGQFIGLTDKNGKKIFEGDIVCTKYKDNTICSIGDVQFDCGTFGAEWTQHKEHRTMVGGWGNRHNLRTFEDDIIDHIEVIGNIYDNPELLGETK